jgi:hypothetical protein
MIDGQIVEIDVRLNVALHDHLAEATPSARSSGVMTRAWIGRSVALLSTPAGIVIRQRHCVRIDRS